MATQSSFHFLLLLVFSATCTCEEDTQGKDNEYVFNIPCVVYRGQPRVLITTSSPSPVSTTLTIPEYMHFEVKNTITRDNPADIILPADVSLDSNGHSRKKTLVVRASGKISINAMDNHYAHDGDMFTVLPTSDLGTHYRISAYPTHHESFFTISSPYPNTVVNYTTAQGQHDQVILEEYESYRFEADDTDLSGTQVQSSKPIAVIAGALVELPVGICCENSLLEQLPPVKSWGYDFIMTPFLTLNSGYLFRVFTATHPATFHFFNGSTVFVEADSFYEGNVTGDIITSLTSNAPIMVVQYMKGEDANNPRGGGPSMVIVPPITSFGDTSMFYVPELYYKPDFTRHTYSISVLTDCELVDGLLLDDTPLVHNSSSLTTHLAQGQSMCCLHSNVTRGSHIVHGINSISSVIVYATSDNCGNSYVFAADIHSQADTGLEVQPFKPDDTVMVTILVCGTIAFLTVFAGIVYLCSKCINRKNAQLEREQGNVTDSTSQGGPKSQHTSGGSAQNHTYGAFNHPSGNNSSMVEYQRGLQQVINQFLALHPIQQRRIVRDVLSEATELLCENLALPGVLRKLQAHGALDDKDVETIKKGDNSAEKVDKMLEILKRKPANAYMSLMEALSESAPDLYREVIDKMKGRMCNQNTSPERPAGYRMPQIELGYKMPPIAYEQQKALALPMPSNPTQSELAQAGGNRNLADAGDDEPTQFSSRYDEEGSIREGLQRSSTDVHHQDQPDGFVDDDKREVSHHPLDACAIGDNTKSGDTEIDQEEVVPSSSTTNANIADHLAAGFSTDDQQGQDEAQQASVTHSNKDHEDSCLSKYNLTVDADDNTDSTHLGMDKEKNCEQDADKNKSTSENESHLAPAEKLMTSEEDHNTPSADQRGYTKESEQDSPPSIKQDAGTGDEESTKFSSRYNERGPIIEGLQRSSNDMQQNQPNSFVDADKQEVSNYPSGTCAMGDNTNSNDFEKDQGEIVPFSSISNASIDHLADGTSRDDQQSQDEAQRLSVTHGNKEHDGNRLSKCILTVDASQCTEATNHTCDCFSKAESNTDCTDLEMDEECEQDTDKRKSNSENESHLAPAENLTTSKEDQRGDTHESEQISPPSNNQDADENKQNSSSSAEDQSHLASDENLASSAEEHSLRSSHGNR